MKKLILGLIMMVLSMGTFAQGTYRPTVIGTKLGGNSYWLSLDRTDTTFLFWRGDSMYLNTSVTNLIMPGLKIDTSQVNNFSTFIYAGTSYFDSISTWLDPIKYFVDSIPGTVATGDAFIANKFIDSATVDFTKNTYYQWNGAGWDSIIPTNGLAVINNSTGNWYIYRGSSWYKQGLPPALLQNRLAIKGYYNVASTQMLTVSTGQKVLCGSNTGDINLTLPVIGSLPTQAWYGMDFVFKPFKNIDSAGTKVYIKSGSIILDSLENSDELIWAIATPFGWKTTRTGHEWERLWVADSAFVVHLNDSASLYYTQDTTRKLFASINDSTQWILNGTYLKTKSNYPVSADSAYLIAGDTVLYRLGGVLIVDEDTTLINGTLRVKDLITLTNYDTLLVPYFSNGSYIFKKIHNSIPDKLDSLAADTLFSHIRDTSLWSNDSLYYIYPKDLTKGVGSDSGIYQFGSRFVWMNINGSICNLNIRPVFDEISGSYSHNTHIGYLSGNGSSGFSNSFIGANSGQYSSGDYTVAIGHTVATYDSSDYSISLGFQAGQYNKGNNSILIGNSSGLYNIGANAIFIGYGAGGGSNLYDDVIAIGNNAGNSNVSLRSILIGKGAGGSNNGDSCIFIGTSENLTNNLDRKIYIGHGDSTTQLIWGRNTGFTFDGAFSLVSKQNGYLNIEGDLFVKEKLQVDSGAVINGNINTSINCVDTVFAANIISCSPLNLESSDNITIKADTIRFDAIVRDLYAISDTIKIDSTAKTFTQTYWKIAKLIGDGKAIDTLKIGDGVYSGQQLIIVSLSSTNTITLIDNQNVQLTDGTAVTLQAYDSIILYWDAILNDWVMLHKNQSGS